MYKLLIIVMTAAVALLLVSCGPARGDYPPEGFTAQTAVSPDVSAQSSLTADYVTPKTRASEKSVISDSAAPTAPESRATTTPSASTAPDTTTLPTYSTPSPSASEPLTEPTESSPTESSPTESSLPETPPTEPATSVPSSEELTPEEQSSAPVSESMTPSDASSAQPDSQPPAE